MPFFPAFTQKFKASQRAFCISVTVFSVAGGKFFKCFMGIKNCAKLSTNSVGSIISDHIRNQRLNDARLLFNKIQDPSLHLYTKVISGYTRNNRLKDALQLFYKMPIRDTVSWNSMIKGCLNCGDLDMARKIFEKMPDKDVISWTTIINGFFQHGRVENAEFLYCQMPSRDIAAWNSMIYGYISNNRIEDALKLFEEMPYQDVITWTSLISGLEQMGRSGEALSFFSKMLASGVKPTSSTFSSVLAACTNELELNLAVQIHARVLKCGCLFDPFISASLITFYSNCRRVDDSCRIFYDQLHMNVVIWTALLTSFSLNSRHDDALKVFHDMINIEIFPNQFTFASALNSCSELEALDRGKEIHTLGIKLGLGTDVSVGNSLVVMYSKCGNIYDSIVVFKGIEEKNLISWNSIIVGCAQNGFGVWALTSYGQMVHTGVEPDEITITGLLSACGHSGMLDKGRRFFKYFKKYRSLYMNLEHYACMVDILGRCGKLEEAEDLIKNMTVRANHTIWLTLLSACRMLSNLEVGERVAKYILELEPNCSAAYVLLSNIYASASRWTDASRVRGEMKQKGIVKQTGISRN